MSVPCDYAHRRSPHARLFFTCCSVLRDLHSFPTRRSSDLFHSERPLFGASWNSRSAVALRSLHQDRKSTRLNSSHLGISYAVFCLKKKTRYDAFFQQTVHFCLLALMISFALCMLQAYDYVI